MLLAEREDAFTGQRDAVLAAFGRCSMTTAKIHYRTKDWRAKSPWATRSRNTAKCLTKLLPGRGSSRHLRQVSFQSGFLTANGLTVPPLFLIPLV